MAELATPGLTTIRQPMEHMGRYAAEVVGNQISRGSLRREDEALKLFEPELVNAAIDGQVFSRTLSGRVAEA